MTKGYFRVMDMNGKPAKHGYLYDEHGYRVSLDDNRVTGASSLSALAGGQKLDAKVISRSAAYKILKALRGKYQGALVGRSYSLGNVVATYPGDLTAMGRNEILGACCRKDRLGAEQALLDYRASKVLPDIYMAERASVGRFLTKAHDVPEDIPIGAFWTEEVKQLSRLDISLDEEEKDEDDEAFDLDDAKEAIEGGWLDECKDDLKEMAEEFGSEPGDARWFQDVTGIVHSLDALKPYEELYKKVHDTVIDAIGKDTLDRWVGLVRAAEIEEKPFYITATFDNVAEWERVNNRQFCGSMNPPYGRMTFEYTEAELVAALRVATPNTGEPFVPEGVRDDVLARVGDECPFCGRHVTECGPIGVWDLFYHSGTVYLNRQMDSAEVVPMCCSCAWTWADRRANEDFSNKFFRKYMDFYNDGKPFPWNLEMLRMRNDAISEVMGICKTAAEAGENEAFPFDLDGPLDVDKYLEWRVRWPNGKIDDSREADVADLPPAAPVVDAMSGITSVELAEGDLAAMEEAGRLIDAVAALNVLNAHFEPLVKELEPLQEVGRIRVPMPKCDGWTFEPLARFYFGKEKHDLPEDVVRVLPNHAMLYAGEVTADIAVAASNRRVAVRYEKAVRTVLDKFDVPRDANLHFLNIPWRKFYYVVVEAEDEKGRYSWHNLTDKMRYASSGWSLERMAEEIGVSLPGRYFYA